MLKLQRLSDKELLDEKYDGLKFDAGDITFVLEDQARLTLRQVVEWAGQECTDAEHLRYYGLKGWRHWQCKLCWQELKRLAEATNDRD